jgi:sucrose-6-phosphate hydrolase SacC (GH32 family)
MLLRGGVAATALLAVAAGIRRATMPSFSDAALVGEVDATAGWVKSAANPVLGGALGTCFDVCLLQHHGRYWMWFSWRPRGSIALVESADGVHWGQPRIALAPAATGWEDAVNRPIVLQREGIWHLWYTGQTATHSWIGHATSANGLTWTRSGRSPVLSPALPWEGPAVMCPDVIWDAGAGLYRMWYSGGNQDEPFAIGHAVSADGIHWSRHGSAPIFSADPAHSWEQNRVSACQVIQDQGWYLMFYIGFYDQYTAHIGLARSLDGLTQWERHPANPILRSGRSATAWDHDAVYKPFALRTLQGWSLWYNGRHGTSEQIGLATHAGHDLGFPRLG